MVTPLQHTSRVFIQGREWNNLPIAIIETIDIENFMNKPSDFNYGMLIGESANHDHSSANYNLFTTHILL